MEEVFENFKMRKFRKCLQLIKFFKKKNDIYEYFLLENCKLICESLIVAAENDSDNIYKMQEQLYLFLDKVTSTGIHDKTIPLELKLIAFFNYSYWLLFHCDVELNISEVEEYLNFLNKSLLIVSGKPGFLLSGPNVFEEILVNLGSLKSLISNENLLIGLLILELVVIVVSYIVKLKKTLVHDALKTISLFIIESQHINYLSSPVEEFVKETSFNHCLCKFSLCKVASLLSELNLEVIDCLYHLKSVFLYVAEDFEGSLKSLQSKVHPSFESLWSYLVVLNAYETGNITLCSKFLRKMSTSVAEKNLKARFHVMQGKLHCIERNHAEALNHFKEALGLCPNCPIFYYFIGREYGRMGLIDLMVENFEKLVKASQMEYHEHNFKSDFKHFLFDWIHPGDEITEYEAHYALAVSYGLNENFKEAAETFEIVLQSPADEVLSKKKRIIEMPSFVTTLHEASIMNLLLGNLVRAEQIALDAIERYVPRNSSEKSDEQSSLLCKDIEWLQRVIQQELLETDLEPKEFSDETLYSEDLILFFPQNVIGLLILSEVQRIQEVDDYKVTLSNVFSILSKFLVSMNKKEKLNDLEERILALVKALAGKTCVKISAIKLKEKDSTNVEKMFKRALSCNKGDRDALYNYYNFLLIAGRREEALKLWNTFSKEKGIIGFDSLQSFSLRYFLLDKTTKRELENIEREIDSFNLRL